MKHFFIQALCKAFVGNYNTTNNRNSSSFGILRDCKPVDTLASEPVLLNIVNVDTNPDDDANSGAVLYIVAVLVFYSAGIMIMIIKYLRTERRELEDERILEDFFRSMPNRKKEREQNDVNRVAIHAFHAMTSYNGESVVVDRNDVGDSEMTYMDTVEEVDSEHRVVSNKEYADAIIDSERTCINITEINEEQCIVTNSTGVNTITNPEVRCANNVQEVNTYSEHCRDSNSADINTSDAEETSCAFSDNQSSGTDSLNTDVPEISDIT